MKYKSVYNNNIYSFNLRTCYIKSYSKPFILNKSEIIISLILR